MKYLDFSSFKSNDDKLKRFSVYNTKPRKWEATLS